MAEETFEDVFRRLLPRALRVARRILGDETQAEDAAAEALARAHASWSKVGRTPYLDAWILRVTANVAVDMGRRRARTFSAGLDLAGAIGPDENIERDAEVTHIALVVALAALPRRQRDVIVLRYLEGLSEEDVAQALGVSLGTVKKNGFRARETLRKRLGTDFSI